MSECCASIVSRGRLKLSCVQVKCPPWMVSFSGDRRNKRNFRKWQRRQLMSTLLTHFSPRESCKWLDCLFSSTAVLVIIPENKRKLYSVLERVKVWVCLCCYTVKSIYLYTCGVFSGCKLFFVLPVITHPVWMLDVILTLKETWFC